MLSIGEYRTLVEQAPILIWRSNRTGECDYFNERWLEYRGRSIAEEYGNGWTEGVHPDDLERCLRIYFEAFNRCQVFEMEYRLKRHDGVYRWVFDRGVPFCGENGDFAGFIGSCIDVTDRVEAETALRMKQQQEIDSLRGLLPICTVCKRIRDDQGYWRQVEEYLSEHSSASFTHGYCPTCLLRISERLGACPSISGPEQ